jgi:hypothetical protein
MVGGAWFLTREVELSTARAALVELSDIDSKHPKVTWHLPASKTDPGAVGTSRTHGCSCGASVSAGCPVHAIWDQLLVLQRTFPHRWSEKDGFDWALPLFPDAEGRIVEKEAMADTIREAAVHLKVALASRGLTEQVTGHSLRATGAQGLARAGVEEWAIQLLGRWGSKAVRSYTRQASLEQSATWARRALTRGPAGDPNDLLHADATTLRSTIKKLLADSVATFGPGLLANQAASIKEDVLRDLRAQGAQLSPSTFGRKSSP